MLAPYRLATVSELDAETTMTIMNESLRIKREFEQANSAIGRLQMLFPWLKSARLQNQINMIMVSMGPELGPQH